MSRPRWIHHEGFVWLIGIATALSAHGAGASILEAVEGHFHITLLGWGSALILFTFAFYYLYANPVPRRLRKEWDRKVFWRGVVPWFLAAFAAIALYGLAAGIHHWIDGRAPRSPSIFVGYAVAFGFVMWVLYRLRDDVMIIKTRSMSADASVVSRK